MDLPRFTSLHYPSPEDSLLRVYYRAAFKYFAIKVDPEMHPFLSHRRWHLTQQGQIITTLRPAQSHKNVTMTIQRVVASLCTLTGTDFCNTILHTSITDPSRQLIYSDDLIWQASRLISNVKSFQEPYYCLAGCLGWKILNEFRDAEKKDPLTILENSAAGRLKKYEALVLEQNKNLEDEKLSLLRKLSHSKENYRPAISSPDIRTADQEQAAFSAFIQNKEQSPLDSTPTDQPSLPDQLKKNLSDLEKEDIKFILGVASGKITESKPLPSQRSDLEPGPPTHK